MSRQVDLGQIVPNVQIGSTTTGNPGTQASVVNVGTDLNPILEFTIPKGEPGAIKMQIVDTLPATGQDDTIYLVPLEHPDIQGNNYAEYIWINNQWELLGKIGVQVDLTDYVKNTDYATKTTNGVINAGGGYAFNVANNGNAYCDSLNYTQYTNSYWNNTFISKGTLENVITGKDLTTKSYVDSLVGDINTALDTINGEVI